MASILSVDVKENKILLNLKISRKEYETLDSATKDILIVPTETFSENLTTGKLGHSNRVMLPKKILKKYGIRTLPKKVPAKIFDLINNKFLIVKLVEKKIGVPRFGEKGEEG